MAEVQKGVVTQFEYVEQVQCPIVRPFGAGDALTPPLKNNAGQLYVGTTVAFVLFEDGTGFVLTTI